MTKMKIRDCVLTELRIWFLTVEIVTLIFPYPNSLLPLNPKGCFLS